MGYSHLLSSLPLQNVASNDYFSLAMQALSEVSDAGGDGGRLTATEVIDDFCAGVLSEDDSDRIRMVSRILLEGYTEDDVVMRIIPAAARRIGELWVQDKLSFVEVSAASAHMQAMVRSFGTVGPDGRKSPVIPLGQAALVAVPAEENHTMGAFVAAHQLRRNGVWVDLAIGQTVDELVRTVERGTYSMVGISAASRRVVPSIKNIVSALSNADTTAKVILGGNVTVLENDLQNMTGAHIVTSNINVAMASSGIRPVARGEDDVDIFASKKNNIIDG